MQVFRSDDKLVKVREIRALRYVMLLEVVMILVALFLWYLTHNHDFPKEMSIALTAMGIYQIIKTLIPVLVNRGQDVIVTVDRCFIKIFIVTKSNAYGFAVAMDGASVEVTDTDLIVCGNSMRYVKADEEFKFNVINRDTVEIPNVFKDTKELVKLLCDYGVKKF